LPQGNFVPQKTVMFMDPPGPYSASNPPPETSVDVNWPWDASDVTTYTIQNYQTYMNDYFKPEWYNTY